MTPEFTLHLGATLAKRGDTPALPRTSGVTGPEASVLTGSYFQARQTLSGKLNLPNLAAFPRVHFAGLEYSAEREAYFWDGINHEPATVAGIQAVDPDDLAGAAAYFCGHPFLPNAATIRIITGHSINHASAYLMLSESLVAFLIHYGMLDPLWSTATGSLPFTALYGALKRRTMPVPLPRQRGGANDATEFLNGIPCHLWTVAAASVIAFGAPSRVKQQLRSRIRLEATETAIVEHYLRFGSMIATSLCSRRVGFIIAGLIATMHGNSPDRSFMLFGKATTFNALRSGSVSGEAARKIAGIIFDRGSVRLGITVDQPVASFYGTYFAYPPANQIIDFDNTVGVWSGMASWDLRELSQLVDDPRSVAERERWGCAQTIVANATVQPADPVSYLNIAKEFSGKRGRDTDVTDPAALAALTDRFKQLIQDAGFTPRDEGVANRFADLAGAAIGAPGPLGQVGPAAAAAAAAATAPIAPPGMAGPAAPPAPGEEML